MRPLRGFVAEYDVGGKFGATETCRPILCVTAEVSCDATAPNAGTTKSPSRKPTGEVLHPFT